MPGSGTSQELLDEAGLTADHIAAAARRLIAAASLTETAAKRCMAPALARNQVCH